MDKTLDVKLAALAKDAACRAFILADAKDADMAFGIASPGRTAGGRLRSLNEFRDQIREIVSQGLVDIMLMSASTSEFLTIQERIFDFSPVTPAVRANDSSDIHFVRGGHYASVASQPFASATIDHIQAGKRPCTQAERSIGANLGLYSVTFNNHPESDLKVLEAYKAFRLEAEEKNFQHFLEVFHPNVTPEVHGLAPEQIPHFVNDHIARMLAGVPSRSRPRFLKIPYAGPQALEELCAYDPSLVVGALGGSAGTHDASRSFTRRNAMARAWRYSAERSMPRKISYPLFNICAWSQTMRSPAEAVKAYHAALQAKGIARAAPRPRPRAHLHGRQLRRR